MPIIGSILRHRRGRRVKPSTPRDLVTVAVMAVAGLSACETLPFGKDPPKPIAMLEPASDLDDEGSLPILEESSSGVRVSAEQRFSDVPLPAGARLDVERTYVYESTTLQVGRMVYSSRASVNSIAQFYIDECKRQGWNLERVLQANGAELVFTKPKKRLRVDIREARFGRGGRLIIIHLTPEDN